METGLAITFSVAFLATFVGTIPFGPINLSVVSITINKSFQKSFQFSIAASLVEILEAAVAISFGVYIQTFIETHSWIQILIFALFIVIGSFLMFRSTNPKLVKVKRIKSGAFAKGFFVALANPQALPFWIFVLSVIAQNLKLSFSGVHLIWFLTGVFLGKLAALSLFAYLSNFLRTKLKDSCSLVNKTIGGILLLIGLYQATKYFLA
jgi:threonine/homoserine/homoserine lactone efflux protein